MINNGYKNDGFDLSSTKTVPVLEYFAIVDLEELSIIGLYTNPGLLEHELEKLKNFDEKITTVMSFAKAQIDCPVVMIP